MSDSEAISVLIRTFNSARTLGKVLDGVKLREGDEVIVVDSGSADATLAIAKEHQAIVVQATGPFNYSKSLNLGFRAARNSLVVVMSSHTTPLISDFLDTYRNEVRQFPGDVMVGYGPNSISGLVDPLFGQGGTTFYSLPDYDRISPVCGNGNVIYRKSAWEELPFDESIRTAEDKIWLTEACGKGWRFALVPSVRTINKNQAPLRYMYMKGYSDARAMVRDASHQPMRLRHLAGAQKKLLKEKLQGKIDWGNWLRYSSHVFGQYFGSHGPGDNQPWKQQKNEPGSGAGS